MNIRKMKLRAMRHYRASSLRVLVRNTFHRHYRDIAASVMKHNALFRQLVA